MSSDFESRDFEPGDFERRVREARATLPEPDAEATRRARERAWAAARRRRSRVRVAALIGTALALAIGLGIGIGALVTPGVTAARPTGLGFLPEPGWYVLQSGAPASTSRPAVAIASNVPFAREDDVFGSAESSALPYATLLALPPQGVVVVVTFTPRGEDSTWDYIFDERRAPLRVREAVPDARYGAVVRHDAPLGVYRLRAAMNGHNLDVGIYFGRERPEGRQLAAAQRQLERLAIRSSPARASAAPGAAATSAATATVATVFDRTVVCTTRTSGGVLEVETRAHDGVREFGRSSWLKLPFAVVSSGNVTSLDNIFDNSLVWISAGRPTQKTTVDYAWYGAHPLDVGTLGLSTKNCRTRTARIPLSSAGLRGGSPGQLGASLDCVTPQRVIVRVRAVLGGSAKPRARGGFLKTTTPVTEAAFAVRTESGKPVAYAQVLKSGRTKHFTARGCAED